MIPGKKYTLADYERIAWRRRWTIAVPFLVVALGTAIVVQLLPNRYRSETTILVVPQRVPEKFVQPTVNQRIDDRLQMIGQQIMSRTRLERIVQEFNLYERERKEMIMEDVIEQMRTKDIQIGPPMGRRRDDATAFTVRFESNEARTALLVTERLASLFIKENLDDRSVLAEQTSQFLEAQLEDARRRLDDHEKKLAVYRRSNEGTLPTQLQANLQAIQTTQQQIRNVQDNLSRDTDRKLAIEGQLAALRIEGPSSVSAPAPSDDPGSVPRGSATQRLEAARASLKAMELRLTSDHPDMKALKRVIGDLEKAAAEEALQRPVSDSPQSAAAVSPSELARRTRIVELQTESASIDRRLKEGQGELQRLAALTNAYQQRVEATPQRESELTALMRDYETLKDIYAQLLQKNEASKVSANLERRQIGEQFRILDAARLPEKPISPNRLWLNFMGALAGLGLGIGLVVLLEYRDTSLKSETDVIVSLALPVLAVVPAIATKRETLQRRRRRLAMSAAGLVLVVGLTAIAVWKLQIIEQWVR